MREAVFYRKLENKAAACQLCPKACTIKPNSRGWCRTRENRDGTLYALSYGRPVAAAVDPVEKKPLFHFLPGSSMYSIGTAGCNQSCTFCDNWETSQAAAGELPEMELLPDKIIEEVKRRNSEQDFGLSNSKTAITGIAYTYNEPTVFYEYMLDTAKLARRHGICNTLHSCGLINPEPLKQVANYIDAANIDLKYFSQDLYRRISEGFLQPVLDSITLLKRKGVWLELTNLVIPSLNDSPVMIKEMCKWIADNLGADVPLHFSRFFPSYKMLSTQPTPAETLERAYSIAKDAGLHYIYLGNIPGNNAESTYCPECKKVVIERAGYTVKALNLWNGRCSSCQEKIPGVWEKSGKAKAAKSCAKKPAKSL